MVKKERKDYNKKYYEAHKEENKERMKAYRQTHKEEIKVSTKAYYQEHKEEIKAYYQANKDKWKARYQAHNAKYRTYQRAFQKNDTNSSGSTKNSVRCRSSRYLFNTLKHSKLKGYEIHHCFGYEDYKCFIYIPKELHLQIHQYLREKGISADSNHFSQIVHLINDWDGYTYIKV